MELVLPNNYVALEQEEMIYLDGGLFKQACLSRNLRSFSYESRNFYSISWSCSFNQKLINYIKVGGLGGWLIGAAAGVLAGAAGRIAYCIGYGVLNRGCDINGNPYPWDGFISATVR